MCRREEFLRRVTRLVCRLSSFHFLMLRALNITNFVIVDRAELEFDAGFTALTGETGAGKSILIDALAVLLGERADASVVRQGAEKAELSAEFDIAKARELKRWLADNDLAGDDD